MSSTPSILYHAVCPPGRGNLYSVTPERLEEHLRYLANSGFRAITVDEYIAGKSNGKDRVVITFDDGSLTNYEHGAPLLERYGMNATFFVIAGKIGARGKMDRQQIAEMGGRGFSIQSHGLTHIDLTSVDDRTLRDELRLSREILEEITGRPVTHFSAPFGMVNQRLVHAVQKAGYQALWTSEYGVNDENTNRFELKRILVTRNMTVRQLTERIAPNPILLQRLHIEKRTRELLAHLLGRRLYNWLRMKMFGTYQEG